MPQAIRVGNGSEKKEGPREHGKELPGLASKDQAVNPEGIIPLQQMEVGQEGIGI